MEYMGMPLWQLLCIAGVVLVIVEIMTPTMFCLNLALACFGTAVVSLYTADYMTLTVRAEPLKEILQTLKSIAPIDYRFNNDTVYIEHKPNS